jgi:hypothetical protein
MPFLSVLSNPQVIQENAYLTFVYNNLGFSETNTFLFFLGVAVFFIVVFGLSFWALTRFAPSILCSSVPLTKESLQNALDAKCKDEAGRRSAPISANQRLHLFRLCFVDTLSVVKEIQPQFARISAGE